MGKNKPILVVATRNQGKFREISHILGKLPVILKSLKDYTQIPPLSEGGKTFLENAVSKARSVHAKTGGFVLADDSGIECEDLRGDPGVRSARYAGPNATDKDNNEKLVKEIMAADEPSRHVRYVCVLVLIDPSGKETVVEKTCEGVITLTPKGTGGFGYDPYFFLPKLNCTMAELPLSKKNEISHRGKALGAVHNLLKAQLGSSSP